MTHHTTTGTHFVCCWRLCAHWPLRDVRSHEAAQTAFSWTGSASRFCMRNDFVVRNAVYRFNSAPPVLRVTELVTRGDVEAIDGVQVECLNTTVRPVPIRVWLA